MVGKCEMVDRFNANDSLADQLYQQRTYKQPPAKSRTACDGDDLVTVHVLEEALGFAGDEIFELLGKDIKALRAELDELRSEVTLLRAISKGTVTDLKGSSRNVA